MALQKQPVAINFSQGLDTKTDRFQVPPGKFLGLENSVFDTTGQLKKRNGYQALTSLPDTSATTITSFKDSLVACGSSLSHLSQDASIWTNRGTFQPVSLSVLSVQRSSSAQSSPDLAVAPNGFSCTVWKDSDGSCYYKIFNSLNGQAATAQVALPSNATNPRVCQLGRYFIVTFLSNVSTVYHLQYIAIPINIPTSPQAAVDLTSQAKDLSAGYDVCVANNNLYWAVNGSDVGGAVRLGYIDSGLVAHTGVVIVSKTASLVSLTCDLTQSNPSVWLTIYNTGAATTYVYSSTLVQTLGATATLSSTTLQTLTSVAYAGVLTLLYQVQNTYTYSSNRSDYVASKTVTAAGVVSSQTIQQRGVGLSSKAFLINAEAFAVFVYGGTFQPTNFLWSIQKGVVAKLAYENAAGYSPSQVLSFVTVSGNKATLSYAYKDQIVAVNKSQGVQAVGGTYSQTGVNVATFEINQTLDAREIGQNLHLTGGFLWMYDGDRPVEHSFHVWPEDIGLQASSTGGAMSAQDYSYQAVYTWTDAQGNIHRSAPSIPQTVTTAGITSSVTINVPTLRLTRKTAQNKVRIEIFRWSTAQQSFYLVTSISSPLLNDPTVDSVSFVDTQADSAIIGNPLIYTTGSVIENVAFPALSAIALYKSRLIGVSAEDDNLIVISKPVVPGVPVEPTDLISIYLNPTIAPQGSDSKGTVAVPLDDKIIFFKKNAMFYVTGSGPDNTGANNDFSDPILITSAVGCTNPKSIAITPSGIMFQSPDKGIWLLGRDLSTNYIGSGVEAFNHDTVTSALAVPSTNQVRFTLNTGKVLMFDYLMNQWGTFSNTNAISSCIYGGKHTYLDPSGRILQELESFYLDRTTPTLLGLESSWYSLAGLQGYQRLYEINLLGKFISPHILEVSISYDYDDSIVQTVMIYPDNYTGPYGSDSIYGGSITYGGSTRVEDWRIFPIQQKCESFKITLKEHYDPALGVAAGAGLTLSGISALVGLKSGARPSGAKYSAG